MACSSSGGQCSQNIRTVTRNCRCQIPINVKQFVDFTNYVSCVSPRRVRVGLKKRVYGKSWLSLCTCWQGIKKGKVGKRQNNNYYHVRSAYYMPGIYKHNFIYSFATPGSKLCYLQFIYEKLMLREVK